MSASFQPPKRTPVKRGVLANFRRVQPDTLVEVPLEVAQVDTPTKSVSTLAAVTTESIPDTSIADTEPPVSSATDLRAVSAAVLNMRAGPSSQNRIVGALARGERAVITGLAQKGWVPVRAMSSDIKGWVHSRYLVQANRT